MKYFLYFYFLLWLTLEETIPGPESKVRDSIRKQLDGIFAPWMRKTDDSNNKQTRDNKQIINNNPPNQSKHKILLQKEEKNKQENYVLVKTEGNKYEKITIPANFSNNQQTYIIIQQPNKYNQIQIPKNSGNNQIIVIVPHMTKQTNQNNFNINQTMINTNTSINQTVNRSTEQISKPKIPQTPIIPSIPPIPAIPSIPPIPAIPPIPPIPPLPPIPTRNASSNNSQSQQISNDLLQKISSFSLQKLFKPNNLQSSTSYSLRPGTTQTRPIVTQNSNSIHPGLLNANMERISIQSNNAQVIYERVPISTPIINQSINNFLSFDNSPVPIAPVAETILNVTQNNPVLVLTQSSIPSTPTTSAQRALNITPQMNTQQIMAKAQQYIVKQTQVFETCQNNYLASNKSPDFITTYKKCLAQFQSSLYNYFSVLVNYQQVLSSFSVKNQNLTYRLNQVAKMLQDVQYTIEQVNNLS